HRLACLRRRDDQATLTLADRADQVDEPGGQVARVGLQPEPVLRVERDQLGEVGAAHRQLGVQAVHLVEADQRCDLPPALAPPGLAHRALDDVALAQPVLADLGKRDVDVVRPGKVAGGPHERVVLKHVQDARDRDQHIILGDHRLRLAALTVTAAAVAVAEPVAAAPPALAVFLVVAAATAGSVLTVLGLLPATRRGGPTAVPALVAARAPLGVPAPVAATVSAPAILPTALSRCVKPRLSAGRLCDGRRLLDRGGSQTVLANAGLAGAGASRRGTDAGTPRGGVADA